MVAGYFEAPTRQRASDGGVAVTLHAAPNGELINRRSAQGTKPPLQMRRLRSPFLGPFRGLLRAYPAPKFGGSAPMTARRHPCYLGSLSHVWSSAGQSGAGWSRQAHPGIWVSRLQLARAGKRLSSSYEFKEKGGDSFVSSSSPAQRLDRLLVGLVGRRLGRTRPIQGG